MAKTGSKKPTRPSARKKSDSPPKKAEVTGKRPKAKDDARPQASQAGESSKTAADALIGLLESPLVADILAAGAAAALAAFTAGRVSRRREGGSTKALKNAAKAATSAMVARLSEEVEEILKSAKARNAAK